MIKLKPCPFCGKTDSIRAITLSELGDNFVHPDYFTVVCAYSQGGCGAKCGGQFPTINDAFAAWNRRA